MDTKDASLAVTVGLLVLSESLPFLRRHLKTKLPLDGILFAVFAALYLSKCIDDDCAQRAESVIGRDITGDGVIGKPTDVRLSAGGVGAGAGATVHAETAAAAQATGGDADADSERTPSETRGLRTSEGGSAESATLVSAAHGDHAGGSV